MSRTLIFCALAYALALTLSIQSASLWADEAFSAWLASHESLRGLGWSLFHGDSSDLQMGLYYLYLFVWVRLFGAGEYALRAANIPFIFLFSFSLIWTSWAVFRSRIGWVAPALLPFIWHYASEARPYMTMLALSAAAIASLLGFIRSTGPDGKKFPWICLACLLAGSCFDMLFLLVVPPMALVAFLVWRHSREKKHWRYWKLPLKAFMLPFCALGIFFVFTFVRGTAYDYPRPGLRQMASVFYELSGLSGFGPNRKFSLDFRPFLAPLAAGASCFGIGAFFLYLSGRKSWKENALLPGLAAAVCLALLEAVVLSTVLRKQIDVRHLAAIVPMILFLLIAAVARRSVAALASLSLLTAFWMTADIRLAILPIYQKENYRDAVAAASSIQKRTGAVVALAADPVAAAYYGLNVEGPAPCFPIRQDCEQAFAGVPWARGTMALDAEQWPEPRIDAWLAAQREQGKPVLVFAQRDRAHLASDWWSVLLQNTGAVVTPVHGFDLELLTGER